MTRTDLATPPFMPFCADLAGWLEEHGAKAMLVRPDRHVFGTGSAKTLAPAWRCTLSGA